MKPRMTVTDVFHFGDGRTVLAVLVEGDPKLIEAGTYELRRDGQRLQEVNIENEMLTRTRLPPGQRSVSTAERLKVPSGPPARELTLVPC